MVIALSSVQEDYGVEGLLKARLCQWMECRFRQPYELELKSSLLKARFVCKQRNDGKLNLDAMVMELGCVAQWLLVGIHLSDNEKVFLR